MSDCIEILPDSVANQIAAGEVVQRPASVVKELLENAVDAGADKISLHLKDSGKTLIMVSDNGKGMSETDARMCFERHATSKIRKADDLFSIHTKGFRGEALASIAAVAHIDLQTRLAGADTGTHICLEGSDLTAQEACACPEGTIFSVKNLFFNIPARRKFLKSDTAELKNCIDEFQRVALTHPEIRFSLQHNNQEIYHLPAAGMRQRIAGIFGEKYKERLTPVAEETSMLKIEGFVGKPEFAKRTRGEQFIFVNKRFVRNNYLNHAVQMAYEGLLPADAFPSYFLFLEIGPDKIDININPTKTEIKFDDEKSVYALVRTAVKQSLGKYQVAPALDFDRETGFDSLPFPEKAIKQPGIRINPDYNPFREKTAIQDKLKEHSRQERQNWEAVLETMKTEDTRNENSPEISFSENVAHIQPMFQLLQTYIVTKMLSGLLIIHQQRAHERILFEQFCETGSQQKAVSQQLIFPEQLQFSSGEYALVSSMLNHIQTLGFDVSPVGSNTLVVNGVPPEMQESASCRHFFEKLIEEVGMSGANPTTFTDEKFFAFAARQASVRTGKVLQAEEMQSIVGRLFACAQPAYTPDGKKVFINMSNSEIEHLF